MQVKEVGIVLGHGSNAADWNGKFLTELTAALAAEGENCADMLFTPFAVLASLLCPDAHHAMQKYRSHSWQWLPGTKCTTVFAGFLVVRCYCKQKEQRRQRMFEKALDAAATSPFARGVTRWLLAGA